MMEDPYTKVFHEVPPSLIKVKVDREKKMVTISYIPVKSKVEKLLEFRDMGAAGLSWYGYKMSAFEQWAWNAGQRNEQV